MVSAQPLLREYGTIQMLTKQVRKGWFFFFLKKIFSFFFVCVWNESHSLYLSADDKRAALFKQYKLKLDACTAIPDLQALGLEIKVWF